MEKTHPKISVIIPVYNTGSGIRKCLSAVCSQSLRDIEVILIDDCSTDGSAEFLKESARLDQRIRYIRNPENLGPGPSRNRGIKEASGEYLAFVDSDDYIDSGFFKQLYKAGVESGADIIKGGVVLIGKDGKVIRKLAGASLNRQIIERTEQGKPLWLVFHYEHWSAIYRRDWVEESGAEYGSSKNGEDSTFLLKVCCGTEKIKVLDQVRYYYVNRNGSSDSIYSEDRLENTWASVKEKTAFLSAFQTEGENRALYMNRMLNRFLQVQASCALVPGLQEVSAQYLDKIRIYISELPYCSRLVESDRIVEALVQYHVNLTVFPYNDKWGVSYASLEDAVDRITCFIRNHPEKAGLYSDLLKTAFHQALRFTEWKDEKAFTKTQAHKQLRDSADSLPDPKVLKSGDLSLRVFVDTGLNLFPLRKMIRAILL